MNLNLNEPFTGAVENAEINDKMLTYLYGSLVLSEVKAAVDEKWGHALITTKERIMMLDIIKEIERKITI